MNRLKKNFCDPTHNGISAYNIPEDKCSQKLLGDHLDQRASFTEIPNTFCVSHM